MGETLEGDRWPEDSGIEEGRAGVCQGGAPENPGLEGAGVGESVGEEGEEEEDVHRGETIVALGLASPCQHIGTLA